MVPVFNRGLSNLVVSTMFETGREERAVMTHVTIEGALSASAAPGRAARCCGLVAAAALAGVSGLLWTDPSETAQGLTSIGPELATLLRFMALVKAVLGVATLGAIAWRMILPATFTRLTLYLVAASALAFGPGLIWGLAHVLLGAAFLHAGLAACLATLWWDPIVASRLSELVALRRRDLGAAPQVGGVSALTPAAAASAAAPIVRA